MVSNPYQCITYSLLILPPLLLITYFLAAFPSPPNAVFLNPSLASLPPSPKSWSIYPEDFYPGGGYLTLPHGRMRYWLMGPEKGTKIVLIHGLSIPAIIWKEIAPELATSGYRVLLYDLYGRGYSDAPLVTYDATLYSMQLAFLMQHVKWDKAVVMGVSMGGGITAAFTYHFPQLVADKVVLIASAGIMQASDFSRTSKVMSSPLVQGVTSTGVVRKYLQRLTNTTTPAVTTLGIEEPNPVIEIVRLQSAHLPGYNSAISSSLRDGPIRGLEYTFSDVETWKGRRVLLIHGTKDRTVPYKYSSQIQNLLPNQCTSKQVTIEGAGHDLTLTHAATVMESFTAFMRS